MCHDLVCVAWKFWVTFLGFSAYILAYFVIWGIWTKLKRIFTLEK